MSEKTIAVFKYENNKYNLLEITNVEIGTDGIETDLKETYYMVIKNRKRLYNTKWESQARAKFSQCIVADLMQQKISF